MPVKYEITSEQQAEIKAARKKNRNKKIEAKLRILSLRAEGKTLVERLCRTIRNLTAQTIRSITARQWI